MGRPDRFAVVREDRVEPAEVDFFGFELDDVARLRDEAEDLDADSFLRDADGRADFLDFELLEAGRAFELRDRDADDFEFRDFEAEAFPDEGRLTTRLDRFELDLAFDVLDRCAITSDGIKRSNSPTTIRMNPGTVFLVTRIVMFPSCPDVKTVIDSRPLHDS